MTVSLTSTDSTNTDPPTPNDMTSTTVETVSSPPSNTAVIDAPSPASLSDKDQEARDANDPVSEALHCSNSPAQRSNQDDETEEETSIDADEEASLVISVSQGESDSKVQVNSDNKRPHDSDSECDNVEDRSDVSASQQCDASKKVKTCEDSDEVIEGNNRPSNNHKRDQCSEVVNGSRKLVKSAALSDTSEAMSSTDVAEMARLKAAKFIQERTKMACLLPSSADNESATNQLATNSSSVSSGHQSSSRKRKLTVKDILVSQRTREVNNKHQRVHSETNANSLGFSQMFAGLGQMSDTNLQMNDANPLAAISAALAAAAAANSAANVSIPANGANLSSAGLVPDSQSAYISTLASTLSSNANPSAAFALMASLSSMMQNSANKESVDSSVNPLSQLSNQLGSLESTLSNVITNNFSSSHSSANNSNTPNDDRDDHRNESTGAAPLDFSLKNADFKEDNKPNLKRKSRKKQNGAETQDETPLDLSVPTKRPDESEVSKTANHNDVPLSSVLPQVPSMDNSNGGNFAAMAAAAAAAAAASFSPNLLTRMAASMAPWSGYGLQNLKFGNDSTTATNAIQALLQQLNAASNQNSSASNHMQQNAGSNNLFQSFPDLYWNGKGKTPTSSPSFGVLSNSSSSLSSRHHHHPPPPAASQPMRTKSSSGRQNPWQAQWINRSSEQTRDVFTCVWCKESFKSLAEMTDHMKRSPRCGMAGMQQHHSHHHHNSQPTSQHSQQSVPGQTQPISAKMSLGSPSHSVSPAAKEPTTHNPNNSSSSPSTNSNINPAKSSSGVNMPRKLVRGQDVWLGRGAEQTRQILKCMWCGQSFKSLADMTQHMKITQHYTNIISQEQITSWRTPEEKMSQSQVNAVLTCKVCDEAFSSLKELSNHMVKNSHFKENNSRDNSSRSDASTPTPPATSTSSTRSSGSRQQTTAPVSSDRRKKSLPVRKLLELERGEVKKSGDDDDDGNDSVKSSSSQLIECDDCHEKIEPRCFLQHIKQCRLRTVKSDAETDRSKPETEKGRESHSSTPLGFSVDSVATSDTKDNEQEGEKNNENKAKNEDQQDNGNTGDEPSSSGSVLSALEKLIEKNFDTKSRRSQQTGILQRLGIDEEVFPPWQNMAPSPLSAMSPTMATWNSINGVEFSRSSSSSSSNHSRMNASTPMMPQLRYRRNSNSLKDKIMSGFSASMRTTESNGSFSSQETEDESCDDSNSDCGSSAPRTKKKKRLSSSRSRADKSRLNFPISSLLSSPVPARPTSASSMASSVSPTEPALSSQTADHRMTPNSYRSNADETDDDNDIDSPLALCKKSSNDDADHKEPSVNGTNEAESEDESSASVAKNQTHHPLMQLQKLLDKTDNRQSAPKSVTSANTRMSPFTGWHDSPSIKAMSPASSPRTPPIMMQHSPSSASAKSEPDASSYLHLKCAFCDTQIASRVAYRAHLAKVHLSMRDSVDISAISDEELLLLVLAKNSNLPLATSNNNFMPNSHAQVSKVSPRTKETSKRKSKVDSSAWDKSTINNSNKSPSPQIETSQSKFLKYTELAKQLSSKYA